MKTNRLLKNIVRLILVAVIFLESPACLSETDHAISASLPAVSDNLAIPYRTDDLLGIERKDIADLEMWLTMCFTQLAPTHFFKIRDGDKDIQKAIVRRTLIILQETILFPSVFNPIGAKIFIDEVSFSETGKFKVLIRREDAVYGLREYYAEFDGPEDMTVYPKGGSGVLGDADKKAIRRYKDIGESVVDSFIGGEIRSGHFTEIKGRFEELSWGEKYDDQHIRRPLSYLPPDVLSMLAEELDPFLKKYGITLEKALQGKNVVFLIVPYKKPLPEIIEFDEKGMPHQVKVTSHSSQNAVYFFINEEDAHFIEYICKLYREKKMNGLKREIGNFIHFTSLASKMVHEVGAICGLPYRVVMTEGESSSIINTLDDAYRRYLDLSFRAIRRRPLRKELSKPGEFTVSPVNLDTNLPGRDYAGSESVSPGIAQHPTVVGNIRFNLIRIRNFFNNSRLTALPEMVRNIMFSKRDVVWSAVDRMLLLDDETLIDEINNAGPIWSGIMQARNDSEFAMKMGGHEWFDDIVNWIVSDARDLERFRSSGPPISSIMDKMNPPDLKLMAMTEDAVHEEILAHFGQPRALKKPFRFNAKLKMLDIKMTKFGYIDFGKAHKISPGNYMVPCYGKSDADITGTDMDSPRTSHFVMLSFLRTSPTIFAGWEGVSITALTNEEAAAISILSRCQDRRLAGGFLRHPDDRILIDSFIEHERNIDSVIERSINNDAFHHDVTEKDAIYSIIKFEDEVFGIMKTTARLRGKEKDHYFHDAINPPHGGYTLIKCGNELPLITARSFDGRAEQVEVRSHTSNRNITYLFLRDDEYDEMMALSGEGGQALSIAYVKYFRYFVHEIGVRIGLPIVRIEDGEAINDLDDAYREWQKTRYIANPSQYPALSAVVNKPDYIRVDLDLLRGERIGGMFYGRDYAGSVLSGPSWAVKEAIALADDTERRLFRPSSPRSTLLVPHGFFADRHEFELHREYFRGRFDLRMVEDLPLEQYADSVLAKTKGVSDRSVVLVPEGVPLADLERLKSAGIRFINVQKSVLDEMKSDKKSSRANFQLDTYAIMVLVRNIETDMDKNSSVYRLLEFYVKTHFKIGDNMASAQFIRAIAECDISMLINGFLLYRPSEIYNPSAYKLIAETVLSSA